jgi:hypothetical protein
MSQSHLSLESSEAEKKTDDRSQSLDVVASQPHYAHYSFGTNITRKPYGFGNGLDQILAEKGIVRTTPVYDIPNKALIFSFIAAVLRETRGPAEDPVVTMNRVKDQIAAARLEPFGEAIRALQGEVVTEPEYLQKYLRKTRKKAEDANLDPVNIVSEQMATAQSELYDNFKIIFKEVTPYVMRTLLERIDWQWSDALRAERIGRLQRRTSVLTGKESMDEDERQAAAQQARRVGESVEGRLLIKAYMQVVRPEAPRQTEPQYRVTPKLIVRVDPQWDAKLPYASNEKKKEILQKIICLLGQNISSEKLSNVHIARITKTLEGYKVWFINEVNVLSDSPYVHRHPVDATVLHQTHVVHKGKNGFSVSALLAAPSADMSVSSRFHPSFNPLFVRIKTADLDAANLVDLIETQPVDDFSDRLIEQAILKSNARMIAIVNKDVDESAKLEMNMNISTDPDINSANEDARAHLEKIKIQLQVLGERVRVLSEDSPLDVRARVLHNAENVKIFHDVSVLRDAVVNKIRQQLQDVDAQQKELESQTQAMSRAFNEKMMADDNVAAAEAMSTPLRLTLMDFFSFPSSAAGVVFARLSDDLVADGDKEAITDATMLEAYVKTHLVTKQLLDRINHILFAYPKQKNKDQSENKAFVDFAMRLKANLMEHLDGLPAFELGKTTGGKLVYNPGKLMEQMRYQHASRILSDKKLLLDKIHQVGMVREDIDDCSHMIQTLGHRFEKESDELVQIKKTRAIIDKYINDISAMLNAVSREIGYMVPEFFASIKIFSPQMNKKQADAITLDLTVRQQHVNEGIGAIGVKLKKLINTSAALAGVAARVEDLKEFERRFDVNKATIESMRPGLDTAVGEIIGVTIPLINQKKVLDHAHTEIYQNLKVILFTDIQSWTKRVGGEIVVIDELPYRVPHRLAAIIKAIQAADQDDSLQPGDKLKSVLLPQAVSPDSVVSKSMFKVVKQGLMDMKHSESVLKLSAIIDKLRQLAKTPHFNMAAAFKEPLAELAHFIKKKPSASPRQTVNSAASVLPVLADEQKSVRTPRQTAKPAARAKPPIMLDADSPESESPKPRRSGRPKK